MFYTLSFHFKCTSNDTKLHFNVHAILLSDTVLLTNQIVNLELFLVVLISHILPKRCKKTEFM